MKGEYTIGITQEGADTMYIIVGQDDIQSREAKVALALGHAGYEVLYIINKDKQDSSTWSFPASLPISISTIGKGEGSMEKIEDLDWEEAEFFYINKSAFTFTYGKEIGHFFAMCRQYGVFSCLDMAECDLPSYTSEVITDFAREADIVHIPETDEPAKSMAVYLYGGCRIVVYSNKDGEIIVAAGDTAVHLTEEKEKNDVAALMAGFMSGIGDGLDFSKAAYRALGAGSLGPDTKENWDHGGQESV